MISALDDPLIRVIEEAAQAGEQRAKPPESRREAMQPRAPERRRQEAQQRATAAGGAEGPAKQSHRERSCGGAEGRRAPGRGRFIPHTPAGAGQAGQEEALERLERVLELYGELLSEMERLRGRLSEKLSKPGG
jgi:hypothetical protein